MASEAVRESQSPRLPPELEAYIFEIAAYSSDRKSLEIWNLQLVARRVRDWIQPILFESFFAEEGSMATLLKFLETKPPEFIQRTVKHLYFDSECSRINVKRILTMCTGVKTLVLTTGLHYDALSNLRLTKLTTDICFPSSESFELPTYAHLTHLECHFPISKVHHLDFSTLKCLNYLAFRGPIEKAGVEKEKDMRCLTRILKSCNRLRLVLFLLATIDEAPVTVRSLRSLASCRAHIWFCQGRDIDWKDHLRGNDIWKKVQRLLRG